MKETNIYDYSDLNEYLNIFVKAKETSSKAFSFRSMATRLTQVSHSQLFQIFKGKKKFPLHLTQEMTTKVLKLNRMEKRYFKALVEINHHVLDGMPKDSIRELKTKLIELKPLNIKSIDFDEVTSRPLTMILFEMLGRSNINNIGQVKADIFLNSYSQREIDESLKYLIETGHIAKGPKGELSRLVNHLMSPNDVPSKFIRDYHKEVSSYVPNILDSVDIQQREFQSFAININAENLPKAKELIRSFVHDFARQMEVPNEKLNRTYNLNLQFFPLTKV